MDSTVIVLALVVGGIVAASVALALRARRDRALADRLDAADPGEGLRAHAEAERGQAGSRGQAGGMSWSGSDQNSA